MTDRREGQDQRIMRLAVSREPDDGLPALAIHSMETDMDWKEFGRGAALALYREGCVVAVVTGPHIDGYRVSLKADARELVMPDLGAAKARAEREALGCDAPSGA